MTVACFFLSHEPPTQSQKKIEEGRVPARNARGWKIKGGRKKGHQEGMQKIAGGIRSWRLSRLRFRLCFKSSAMNESWIMRRSRQCHRSPQLGHSTGPHPCTYHGASGGSPRATDIREIREDVSHRAEGPQPCTNHGAACGGRFWKPSPSRWQTSSRLTLREQIVTTTATKIG